jgi:hypothetical protein
MLYLPLTLKVSVEPPFTLIPTGAIPPTAAADEFAPAA